MNDWALQIRINLTANTEQEAVNQSELIVEALFKALPPGCEIFESEEYKS